MVWPFMSFGQAAAFAQGIVDPLHPAVGVQQQDAFDHAVEKRFLAGLGLRLDLALLFSGRFSQLAPGPGQLLAATPLQAPMVEAEEGGARGANQEIGEHAGNCGLRIADCGLGSTGDPPLTVGDPATG